MFGQGMVSNRDIGFVQAIVNIPDLGFGHVMVNIRHLGFDGQWLTLVILVLGRSRIGMLVLGMSWLKHKECCFCEGNG